MRTFGKWTLAIGLLVMGVSGVRSEEPTKKKIIAEEGAVELMLLRQESVQSELKLTKDQVEKIDTFSDGQWKKLQEIHKTGGDKAHAEFEELGKANRKFVHDTLKPEQHKRLVQIGLQVAGLIWVLDPHVSKELAITEAQKAKITELHKAAHKEVEEVIHSADKSKRTEKMADLRKVHRKQLLEVLTDDQKAKWKELAGEPFKGQFHFAELDAEKGK
ncbi:hypothetical protein [Frigoriglobus tundricola]|uniref:LTXXQ motif family protein n=1 Tax=Frigoriglobus tundricola TaxID=2774151 RepID=A0A6M5YK25_9BACT|nr:hypothetical protein [Frigoriglobus tundricola]QJW93690.1 hypothetical protein FTUN_1198 [Frigoriglobus tundricola]